jgi:hypothetical protein
MPVAGAVKEFLRRESGELAAVALALQLRQELQRLEL